MDGVPGVSIAVWLLPALPKAADLTCLEYAVVLKLWVWCAVSVSKMVAVAQLWFRCYFPYRWLWGQNRSNCFHWFRHGLLYYSLFTHCSGIFSSETPKLSVSISALNVPHFFFFPSPAFEAQGSLNNSTDFGMEIVFAFEEQVWTLGSYSPGFSVKRQDSS